MAKQKSLKYLLFSQSIFETMQLIRTFNCLCIKERHNVRIGVLDKPKIFVNIDY